MSPSEGIEIVAVATEGDLEDLARALAALSADLGDDHRASREALAGACLGACPACHGIVARAGGGLAGAALVSPVFSTRQGAAGAFVSDLWVGQAFRGRGLGERLLAEAARLGAARWRARFLTLTVHDDNAGARRFYDRLGFEMQPRDRVCVLGAERFGQLLGDDA